MNLTTTKLAVFVGTRPEIIKMESIVREAPRYFEVYFVHTGQHYDWKLSSSFIRELGLPKPDFYLGAGSGRQQFARVIDRADALLRRLKPDIVLVEGDTNSAAGVAISARKLRLMLGHVEAGCRSFEPEMQEEVNRTLIADCAQLNFAATRRCVENLRREGVNPRGIFLTGHPVVRTISSVMSRARLPNEIGDMKLRHRGYALLTTHREENVDDPSHLRSILDGALRAGVPIIFPVHPHTLSKLKEFHLIGRFRREQITLTPPVSFATSLSLISSAFTVFTDSGGVQQEAALLRTPCITLRDRTEWVETVEAGVNFLSGQNPEKIAAAYSYVKRNYERISTKFMRMKNLFGTKDAPSRILELCRRYTR